MFNVAIFETNGSVMNQAVLCGAKLGLSSRILANNSKQLQWSIQNVTIGVVPLSSHVSSIYSHSGQHIGWNFRASQKNTLKIEMLRKHTKQIPESDMTERTLYSILLTFIFLISPYVFQLQILHLSVS